jgi:hypothetical protein
MSETKKDRRRAAENPIIKVYMANLVPQREGHGQRRRM